MKLPQLKDLCRAHGVKVTGTKPDLISRLKQAVAAEEVPDANAELIPLQEAQQNTKIFSSTLKKSAAKPQL